VYRSCYVCHCNVVHVIKSKMYHFFFPSAPKHFMPFLALCMMYVLVSGLRRKMADSEKKREGRCCYIFCEFIIIL
jgi:hypothetical protein